MPPKEPQADPQTPGAAGKTLLTRTNETPLAKTKERQHAEQCTGPKP